MAHYRIRTLDSGGTAIADFEEACGSDDEARRIARTAIRGGGVAEIWAGLRKIDSFFVALPAVAG